PFFFRASISGTVFNDLDRDGRQDHGEPGLAGRTMQLIGLNDPANPVVVATTTTDSRGNYSFDVFDGLTTGNFQVAAVLPSGWRATTQNRGTVNIRGGERFRDGASGTAGGGPARAPAAPSSPPATAGTTGTTGPVSDGPAFAPPSQPVGSSSGGGSTLLAPDQ